MNPASFLFEDRLNQKYYLTKPDWNNKNQPAISANKITINSFPFICVCSFFIFRSPFEKISHLLTRCKLQKSIKKIWYKICICNLQLS